MDRWHEFFSAEVGASTALAGLLFVAISINITRILQYRSLPLRAAQTLIILGGAIAVSSLALFPEGDTAGAMWAMSAVAFLTWLLATLLLGALRLTDDGQITASRLLATIASVQLATLPMLVGCAAGALFGTPIYELIAAGVILALLMSLLNAWVLLVEILR